MNASPHHAPEITVYTGLINIISIATAVVVMVAAAVIIGILGAMFASIGALTPLLVALLIALLILGMICGYLVLVYVSDRLLKNAFREQLAGRYLYLTNVKFTGDGRFTATASDRTGLYYGSLARVDLNESEKQPRRYQVIEIGGH